MTLGTLQRALFAVSLGFLPMAAGCASHLPLPSDVARRPIAWTGDPMPLKIGIVGISNRADKKTNVVADVLRKSMVQVIRSSKIVESVREIGPAASVAAARTAKGAGEMDLLLACEVEDFDLYSSYLWWLLYALVFTIPFAGTASVLILLLVGAPVASDHARLFVRADAIEPRTGKVVGTYRGAFDEVQPHSIYRSHRVDDSVLSHPERIFQGACGGVASAMIQDRWWLHRFKRPPGQPAATPAGKPSRVEKKAR